MLFNDHIATAEQELIDAVNQLNTAGISDLVLDIRYNGGGFLDIASELAYMIAGNARTSRQDVRADGVQQQAPDDRSGDRRAAHAGAVPFHAQAASRRRRARRCRTLNLPRVFVLTGSGTCSASESIINSLQGVDVEVIQIGSTTCGKPYGFYPQDNCGTTYFSDRVPGRERQGLRRLSRRLLAGQHREQRRRGRHGLFRRRRLLARAGRSAGATLCRRARVSTNDDVSQRLPDSRLPAPLRCPPENPRTA